MAKGYIDGGVIDRIRVQRGLTIPELAFASGLTALQVQKCIEGGVSTRRKAASSIARVLKRTVKELEREVNHPIPKKVARSSFFGTFPEPKPTILPTSTEEVKIVVPPHLVHVGDAGSDLGGECFDVVVSHSFANEHELANVLETLAKTLRGGRGIGRGTVYVGWRTPR